ncbi:MAG: orotidine-5'-phosphate decarboxylase [Alphaproteobacteria bacterium]|nr:orotidine-5'-phosphate decarboxylase [Alphaproteobacteria bacterium]
MTKLAPEKCRIFVAADTPHLDTAMSIAKAVDKKGAGLKLGLEFFNSQGPGGVRAISEECRDLPIFLDLKYYDIPNTVCSAIKAILDVTKPSYLNVHASGGLKMMQEAKKSCRKDTKLLAVTALTSFDEDDFTGAGYKGPIAEIVEKQAMLAKEAGLDGVVCSAHEIERLRAICGKDFILMVPGIRPAGEDAQDQKRVMTPSEAIELGASHLVIGRPITQANNPEEALQAICQSL